MSWHRVSPSPFLSSSASHTTQLHYTNSYTYSYPNLNFLKYILQILITHVMWSAQAVRDSKIDSPSIRLVQNPKHIIVQWVGIGTHTHTHACTHTHFVLRESRKPYLTNVKIVLLYSTFSQELFILCVPIPHKANRWR